MNTTTTMNSPRVLINQVTPEEIAHVERLLASIDLKNAVLGSVSQWLLLWTDVRDFSVRYAQTSDDQKAKISDAFKNLLEGLIQVGKRISSLLANTQLSSEDVVLATGCDLESFDACIDFLNDTIIQWFDASVTEEMVREIWRKAA